MLTIGPLMNLSNVSPIIIHGPNSKINQQLMMVTKSKIIKIMMVRSNNKSIRIRIMKNQKTAITNLNSHKLQKLQVPLLQKIQPGPSVQSK